MRLNVFFSLCSKMLNSIKKIENKIAIVQEILNFLFSCGQILLRTRDGFYFKRSHKYLLLYL